MDGYTLPVLKDTQLGMIQTQTVLMSNKLREKLEICKSIKTTVSYADAKMCARKSEDCIFACKTQCRRSSLVLCTWLEQCYSAIPSCFSARQCFSHRNTASWYISQYIFTVVHPNILIIKVCLPVSQNICEVLQISTRGLICRVLHIYSFLHFICSTSIIILQFYNE